MPHIDFGGSEVEKNEPSEASYNGEDMVSEPSEEIDTTIPSSSNKEHNEEDEHPFDHFSFRI